MNSPRIKEMKNRRIKNFDKSIKNVSKPLKETVANLDKSNLRNENNITDYGTNQIKTETSRIKQKTLSFEKSILTSQFKNAQPSLNNTQIKKLKDKFIVKLKNRNHFKKSKIINSTAFYLKETLKATKNLISIISTFSFLTISIIIFLCFIGLFCSSPFGIFFSSTKENNTKISDYIVELNDEMNNKIQQIKTSILHDDVVIESDKAEWKDILILYSVKVSEDNLEVLTLDQNKKDIMRGIFWDMNILSYQLIPEKINDTDRIENLETNTSSNYDSIIKNVLHIYIKKSNIDEVKKKYNFNDMQISRFEELSNEKNNYLWNSAIYGVYSDSPLEFWKQTDPQWSSVKIGTTSKNIGEIGCLVTSIAILIEKSGVPKDIHPFNPGTFVLALNNNYGFDEQGNLIYAAITKIVPNFKFQGFRVLRGKTKTEKYDEIKKYNNWGYSIAIEVKGATSNSQHWVALNNITEKDITMYDPSSNEVNLWEKYNWENTSQFIFFTNF